MTNPMRNTTFWKALLFGLAFGFLLQKGGVAKFHLLIGVLLLEDFTVMKVMLSAIAVGMLGTLALRRLKLIEFSVKPLRYGANIVGGLVFGAGFACSGYCPGTGAAALGQGNGDAIFMALGMIEGSYLFALTSRSLDENEPLQSPGEKLRLPSALRMRATSFTIAFAFTLALTLWALDQYVPQF